MNFRILCCEIIVPAAAQYNNVAQCCAYCTTLILLDIVYSTTLMAMSADVVPSKPQVRGKAPGTSLHHT